ncbi:Integrin alpha-3 [Varanus komodoensis]|nr:Integrin alpha-3 [Varanus komodoensis]
MSPGRSQRCRTAGLRRRLRRQSALLLGCSLWISLCSLRCAAFNLDTKFLVLKKGKTPDSFFGLSVALHHQENPQRYLLLTGAPRDRAVEMENATRTGAMYACPLTSLMDDCVRVNIKVASDSHTNVVEDMWLGVTVGSQRTPKGRVMACAHRYIRILWAGTEEQKRMVGKCYIRGNDLDFSEADEWQTYHNEMCDPGTDFEMTGMCQMGISGGFTNSTVYFGAPGAFHWQGTNYVIDQESWEKNDYFYEDHENRNGYLGYSTEVGDAVLHKHEKTIIAGAPRNNHTGAILLMVNNSSRYLQKKLVLSGDQVGSYFGSAIALADLNNDGWQDLIVGAPYYFNRKEEKGGAVHVFMNLGGTFHSRPNITLTGPRNSSFGFAVANIGDVDKDDFPDIAIGAPFEGSGKVYIYHSSVGGLIDKPRQVISGDDIGPGIKTFGYSFSGGMDVDENSYPDLLVGTLSESIVLLRARPVINILNKTFKVTPRILDPSKCSKESCITIELCFSYSQSAGDPNYREIIQLNYTVEADWGLRRPRVYFPKSGNATYEGTFSMPSKCESLTVLLQGDVQDKLSPIAFSMNYSLAEKPMEFQLGLRSLDAFPVLNEDQPSKNYTEIQFQKDCGSDNKCTSNLQLQTFFWNDQQQRLPRQNGIQVLSYNPEVKRQNLSISISVTNIRTTLTNGEDAHKAKLTITFPPTLLPSSIRPSGACTVNENVMCELGNPFKMNQTKELNITFEIIGITLTTHNITIQMELDT